MIPLGSLSSLAAISSSLLAIYSSLAYGIILPAKRQFTKPPGFSLHTSGTGVKASNLDLGNTSSQSLTVSNFRDALYTVNVTIGGQDATVQLDTGSVDFWVYIPDTPLKLTNKTTIRITERYGIGSASGILSFAELQLGQYTVPNQAFLNVDVIKGINSELKGILGMAFDVSYIHHTIETTYGKDAAQKYGKAPISNIFAQNASQPNFFDVRLGRTSDLDDISDGTFTISEHIAGYEDVVNQPKLERLGTLYWAVALDAMEVNGKAFEFAPSSFEGIPSGKIVTVLDTGYTAPPIPPAAVDYIYSSIDGAVLHQNTWFIPCLGATNLTFVFGGQPYPIHPLDLTTPVILPYTEDGVKKNTTVCVNNYEYFTLDPASFSVDAFLGDAFLRNVYASFDYGDYDPATKKDGQPFVQLLSTTKQDAAWAEFQSARAIALKSLPPTIDPKDLFNPNSSSDATNKTGDGTVNDAGSGNTHVRVSGVASDTDGEDSDLTSLVKKYGPIVIGLLAGNLIVGLLLFLVGLAVCVKGIIKGGAKTRTMGSAYVPVNFKEEH